MIGYYKDKDIAGMWKRLHELEAEYGALCENILHHGFSTSTGEEFARHGFLRRCDILWDCVQKTFDIIPPDINEKPSRDQTKDVTIFLHCFMVHVFGACDDLAWILVLEKDIKRPDGRKLPQSRIGFRKDNKIVRDQLPENMLGVLKGFQKWFDHVDEFRHSLAHRIPLYVPPFIVHPDNEADYLRLERDSFKAQVKGNLEDHRRLKKAQDDLTFFRPWFLHSFLEKSPRVVIHPQMLADFGAVIELGEATFLEL